MKKEIVPIGELKQRLMSHAESGERIMHDGHCLFSGFRINKNWTERSLMLRERLESLVIEGAAFGVLVDVTAPYEPTSEWTEVVEYWATAEPEV